MIGLPAGTNVTCGGLFSFVATSSNGTYPAASKIGISVNIAGNPCAAGSISSIHGGWTRITSSTVFTVPSGGSMLAARFDFPQAGIGGAFKLGIDDITVSSFANGACQ